MKPDIGYEKMQDVESRRGETQVVSQKHYRFLIFLTCLTTALLILMSIQTLHLPVATSSTSQLSPQPDKPLVRESCTDPCSIVLVESIPEGLVFNSSTHQSIYEAWRGLISGAQSSLDIASFYWTLNNSDTRTQEPTAAQGEQILLDLARLSGKIQVRVAVDKPPQTKALDDITFLANSGADVRLVNMRELTKGVLHTKFWIVDKKHIYIGSANMDWRSLTQVKELGAVVYDCGCLAEDLGKIFEAYWYLNQTKTVPTHWPHKFSTLYNNDTPMELSLNGTDASVYLSSSPPSLCPEGRTPDVQSILSVIGDAQQFVYIAVMNYLPTMEFSNPKGYWPVIDTELRRVAYERKVRVRLLISCWDSTNPIMFPFLRSLASLHNNNKLDIQVKIFTVPSTPQQKKIPFARVNHNKYMVTDKVAYIGTSNWSGDYFVHTAGSALIVKQSSGQASVQQQLQAVFQRDWDSPYSSAINHYTNLKDVC